MQNTKISKVLAAIAIIFFVAAISMIVWVANKPTSKQPEVGANVSSVAITKDGFVPATLSIAKNTKVIWKNSDISMHQIQANPHPTGESLPGLKSEILNNDHTYEYTFTKTGIFTYHDHLNPSMNGVIEVKEAAK